MPSLFQLKEEPDLSDRYPISVAIPFRNDLPSLQRCVQALLANNLRNCEILIVDDASDPERRPDLNGLAGADRVQLLQLERCMGPAGARNAGLSQARHPWIFFLDADVVIPPKAIDWLRETLDLYSHRPEVAGALGAYSADIPHDDFWSQYKNLTVCQLYESTETVSPYIHTPMLCIRRDLLESTGGFDASYATAEDFRLGVELGSRGHRFIIDRRLKGVHLKRYSLKGILREDARRLRDLSRLSLQSDQKRFAWKAHRVERLICAVTPGPALASSALALIHAPWAWAALALVLAFYAGSWPLARYMSRRRGRLFAWKARGFLFVEMLWAEIVVARNLFSRFRIRGPA